jgi:hypothetical protein
MSALDLTILIYSYAFSGLLVYLIDHGLERRYQIMSVGVSILIFLGLANFYRRYSEKQIIYTTIKIEIYEKNNFIHAHIS